ncbi:unnamed protein product [Hyaloperonospora brassicae]|uniref:PH domain-containing protein n=1 Tax=Hyaloperonospora brassicae TaxID=162125 RepID=A0AAV0T614_HYABA|nr:unnamed protein product [Hyaloperonospora brassicae]
MTTADALKLQLGPFRVTTSIFLVNVLPFRSRCATYVLRVERPTVCGGRINVSIGHPDMPINLLPRSAKDCRKLRFAIRYGTRGKTIRFVAPNTTVYGHWIAVLGEAFAGSAKAAKRSSTNTASDIDRDGYNDDTDDQDAVVTSGSDSMFGHCRSIAKDVPVTASTSCPERDNIVTDMDSCSSSSTTGGSKQTPYVWSDAMCSVVEKPRGAYHRTDVCTRDVSNTDTAVERVSAMTPAFKSATLTSPENDFGNSCAATNDCETTLSSAHVLPQDARTRRRSQSDRAHDCSSVERIQRTVHVVCSCDFASGIRHLVVAHCNRLQPRALVSVMQPFIRRWLVVCQQSLVFIGVKLRYGHHDVFCRTCLYLYRRFRCRGTDALNAHLPEK